MEYLENEFVITGVDHPNFRGLLRCNLMFCFFPTVFFLFGARFYGLQSRQSIDPTFYCFSLMDMSVYELMLNAIKV